MTESKKLFCVLLVAAAAALAGCGSSEPQSASNTDAVSAPDAKQPQTAEPKVAPTAVAPPVSTAVEAVSRDRVLRAMTCQIVLSQYVGTRMANADTGLPADLNERLKVSAVVRWDDFAQKHAQEAGVQDADRAALVQSLIKLSPTADDRAQTVDTVRDCLDNEP